MSSGTISNNSTASNGGGVEVSAGTTFTLTGGSLTGNTVSTAYGNGPGVYLYSATTSNFTLSPSGAGAVTFGVNDAIYLISGATFNIGTALNTGIDGTVPVAFESAAEETYVAYAVDETMAANSYLKLVSGTINFAYEGDLIYISSLMLK
jgi:hypothetical protein